MSVKNPKASTASRPSPAVAPCDCRKSHHATEIAAFCVEPEPEKRRRSRPPKVSPADHREFHRLRNSTEPQMSALRIGKLTGFSEMTVFAWLKTPPPSDEERNGHP